MVAVIFDIALTQRGGHLKPNTSHVLHEHGTIQREYCMIRLSILNLENTVYDTA